MRQIDADALRGQIVEARRGAGFYSAIYDGFLSAIDRSPTIESKHMKWISVEERLPEKYTIVLCYKDKQYRLGYYIGASYSKGVAAFRHPKDQFAFGVTHWMPMPEPPKGE